LDRVGVRPSGLSPAAQEKAKIAEMFYKQGGLSIQIFDHLNIAKMTLYRYLSFRRIEIGQ